MGDDIAGEVAPEMDEKLDDDTDGGIRTPSPPRETKDKDARSESEAGGLSDLERQESGDRSEKVESPKEDDKAPEPEPAPAPAPAPPRVPLLDEAAVKKLQHDRRL